MEVETWHNEMGKNVHVHRRFGDTTKVSRIRFQDCAQYEAFINEKMARGH